MKKVILNLLKKELFNKDAGDLDNVVWDEVWKETRLQAVGTLVFSAAQKSGVEFDEQTQEKAANQLVRINRSFINHKRVALMFEEAKIPYIIIKGVVSSSYYPDPYIRPMGDTDVLVKKEDFDKAVALFQKNGLVATNDHDDLEKGHHVHFKKENQTVELHFDLPGIPENELSKDVHKLAEDIFEKSIEYDTIYGKIKGPSPFHHGLIMLLHMQEHMQRGGMGLRHLCDWATFVNRLEEIKFLELFEEKLKSIGLWRFACLMSQASLFIGLDRKNWMGDEKELAQMILEDIISGGNFGRKDEQRMRTARVLPKVESNKEKKKTHIEQYFSYGIKMTQDIWPFYKKHKWLLPIGFLQYCFWTAYKLLTKRTKAYDLSKNNERYNLFEQLKLFEK